jgi:putative redox protein
MNDMEITFPGGKRVDARLGPHVVRTDQPVAAGGEDSAPAPFDLFLASLGTCAGLYVLAFCQSRAIPTEGLRLIQHARADEKGHLTSVELEIELPAGFPAKYREAVTHAAEGCKVKRTLANPPAISVRSRAEPAAAIDAR